MAILINDNYSLQAENKAFDARYLDINVPWADCASAIAGIPTYRYPGLTINIANLEWWWKDGITDENLIKKETTGGTLNMSGDTSGGLTTYVDSTTICAHSGLTYNGTTLSVGAVKITTGAADGYVLTSDSDGNASWCGTLPNLYTYSGITANQSIGALPSGQTLGMVYITNTGGTTGYYNLGTTPTGNDITPYQSIEVAAAEDVSVTVNLRVSNTEDKTIYVNSADWTDAGINLQWANITYQNAAITTGGGSAISGYTCAVNHVVSIGDNTLPYSTNGSCNIAIGENALCGNTFGDRSVGIGYNALRNSGGAGANVAIGDNALGGTTFGTGNVVIGDDVMSSTTSGAVSNNVVIGSGAMAAATAGSGNVIIGSNANGNCCSSSSVAIGTNAMAHGDGTYNNAIGNSAMCFVTGLDNNGVGYLSMRDLTSGDGNIGMGTRVAYRNTTGDYNVVLGHYAGCSFTGSSNVMIGYCAGADETTTSNCLIIGNSDTSCLIRGNFSTEIVTVCKLQITNGAADGCVLTSDASGNTSWATGGGGGSSFWDRSGTTLSPATSGDVIEMDNAAPVSWSGTGVCIFGCDNGGGTCAMNIVKGTSCVTITNAGNIGAITPTNFYVGDGSNTFIFSPTGGIATQPGTNCITISPANASSASPVGCSIMRGGGNLGTGIGGELQLCGGHAGGIGTGGAVVICAGASTSGTGGDLCMRAGLGSGTNGRVRICGLPACVSETCTVFIDGAGRLSTGVGTGGGGGIAMSGSTANALTTYVDASGICAEPNLTFNGSSLEFAQGATRTICIDTAASGAGDGLVLCGGSAGADSLGGHVTNRGGDGGSSFTTAGSGGYAMTLGGTGGLGQATGSGGNGGRAILRGGTGGAGDASKGDGGDVEICGGGGGSGIGNGGSICLVPSTTGTDGRLIMCNLPAKGGETCTVFIDASGNLSTGVGGGSGTVTSVAAGNGMTFTTITASGSVTMGTPATLTLATTNTVGASNHCHALSIASFAGSAAGLAPISVGGTSNFLRADGSWAAPAAGTSLVGKTDIYCTALGCHAGLGVMACGVAIGYCALSGATNCENVGVGLTAGAGIITGAFNTAIGTCAMNGGSGNNGSYNIAIGYQALQNNTCASGNIAIGCNAMCSSSATSNSAPNIVIGNYAGASLTSNNYNVIIGHCAGKDLVSGAGNVFLGQRAGCAETGSNYLYIANNASFLVKGCFSNNTICNAGDSADWTTVSDCRIKECVCTICNGLSMINDLNPVSFNYTINHSEANNFNEEKRICNYNFIAQEFETVFPKHVTTSSGIIDGEEVDDFKSINTGHLVPILVKAIQELEGTIHELKARVQALEA